MATITVKRSSGGGLLGLTIEIDGETVGRVRPNKELSHEVAEGRHEVTVKRWPAWVKAELELAEDEEIRLVCSEASGFSSRGRPSPTKVGRALFTQKGGLSLEIEGDPAES